MSTEHRILKTDEHERIVFGWGSVSVSTDGEQFADLQGDMIAPADLEKAAYEFVIDFRKSGEMHEGSHTGVLVESCIFTPEKIEKIFAGLVADDVIKALQDGVGTRWLVGFKFEPESFAKVLSGEYKMFSIQGRAVREPVTT